MPGVGKYESEPTEGIVHVEDLPAPRVVEQSRNYKHRPCPHCGHSSYRHREQQRKLLDVGDLVSGRPRVIHLTYSQHHCSKCRRYFNADTSDLAPQGGHYTRRVVCLAVRLVVEDGLPYRTASWHLWRDHRVFVPFATIQNWMEEAGKKSRTANRRRLSRLGPGRLLRVRGR